MAHDLRPPGDITDAWFDAPVVATPLSGGLINGTWRLTDAAGRGLGILQRVNGAIFAPTVHADLDAVSRHVRARGLLSPVLIPTRDGRRWVADTPHSWRLLTEVGDRSYDVLPSHDHARAAGRLVGRWHDATADLDHVFQHVRRPAPHDTDHHLAVARDAIDRHADHPLHAEVAPLVDRLAAHWDTLRGALPDGRPIRVVHGDLKASNLRFDEAGDAVALIDLDTCARDVRDMDLGDLLRSTCASGSEDASVLEVDVDRFEAAMTGYAEGAVLAPPTEGEWSAVIPGMARIATELAMRFAADALREAYFGWDATRYPSRGHHNLLRARGQAALGLAVWDRRAPLDARLAHARRARPRSTP